MKLTFLFSACSARQLHANEPLGKGEAEAIASDNATPRACSSRRQPRRIWRRWALVKRKIEPTPAARFATLIANFDKACYPTQNESNDIPKLISMNVSLTLVQASEN